MGRCVKKFITITLGLTAATVLILTLPALSETSGANQPGAPIPAQGSAPEKENAPCCSTPSPQKPKSLKSMRPPGPQMEKISPRMERRQQTPAAAGTKRIGGQTIRDKEAPDGE